MASPFDPVRRAVAAGRIRGKGAAFVAALPAVGRYRAGTGLVATYPGTAYPRVLERMATTCSRSAPVAVYLGAITPPATLTVHGDGSRADYTPASPPVIPGGVPVIVVWDTDDSSATASATAQFREIT